MIKSPDRMPAFAAGVSSIGETTLTRPSSIVTSMPKPAELAVGGLLHVAPGLLIHVARMRIERGDHAVDGALDQLGVVGLFDIVGPDPLEHVAEQIELRIGVGRWSAALAAAIQNSRCGPAARRVRHVPATAPRKKREFLRIVREPSRCQLLLPTMGG